MKEKKSSNIIVLSVLIGLLSGFYYISKSQLFERVAPKIQIDKIIYWNLKTKLNIKLEDDSGIIYYKVIFNDGIKDIILGDERLGKPKQSIDLNIGLPKLVSLDKATKGTLKVIAIDNSKWNFLLGNKTKVISSVVIDKEKPKITIINKSYSIRRGGSALIIFKAEDQNLKNFYIETNFGKKFIPQPFFKEGYYISLLGWPVTKKHFKASLIAYDKAGNKNKLTIPFYLKTKKYRLSTLILKDKFLDGKIAELANRFDETAQVADKLEKFRIINEVVRAKNEKLIHQITSVVSEKMISNFEIKPFYPLKNGAAVASFGDHRKFYYQNTFISESFHLGLDLASIRLASLYNKNNAKVVYNDDNGIYGNMLSLSFGLGLYTIYGHCSSINVSVGENIINRTKLASTGRTGLALGDHLHFGILVQGIEVRPEEWMDKLWIKKNITDIIENSKKVINRQSK